MEGKCCVLSKGKIYERILENGSFKTDNEKLCRNCGRMKLFDEFNRDNKQCKQCSENKRNNRIKHKDRYNEEQRKFMKKMMNIEIKHLKVIENGTV